MPGPFSRAQFARLLVSCFPGCAGAGTNPKGWEKPQQNVDSNSVLTLDRQAGDIDAAAIGVDELEAQGSGLDTLLTKGDGGRDGVFGFPERALAGLGWVNFR
jgi:hypothetical protein